MTNCTKIDTCEKIKIIMDKDMLDFQYADCIREVCMKCNRPKGYDYAFNCEVCGKPFDRDGGHSCGAIHKHHIDCPHCGKIIEIGVV
jgi:predicted amidophosphoribosyltransferase